MRSEHVLSRPLIGIPITGAISAKKSSITPFHQPGYPASDDLIVVVVLPHVAVAVNGGFVAVAKTMPQYLQASAIWIDTKLQATYPDLAVVAALVAFVFVVVGGAAGVYTASPQSPARLIPHIMWPGIAYVEIPFAIRAGYDRMEGVVVVFASKAREQNFFSIGNVVAIFIGVNDQIGRARHDDLLAHYGNTQRRNQVFVLDKYFGGIGFAIAIGIFQNHHPIPFVVVQVMESVVVEGTVVDGFGDPNPPSSVHIHIGRVVKQGTFGPEAYLQVVGEVQLEGVLWLRFEEQRDQKEEKYGGEITTHCIAI